MPPRKYYPSTPFAKWLVRYASQHNIALSDMAVEAGLSYSTLYKYIQNARQKPELRVILRLSEYTEQRADDLARLAGFAGYKPREPVGPDLRELMNIYNRLPISMQKFMLTNARQLAESVRAMKARSSENTKKR